MYRQGDLLIVAGDLPDRELRKVENGVVQLGEATGHAHVLEGGEVFSRYDQTYLHVHAEGARLIHDEHDTITLPEGKYRVLRQREFSEDGGWGNVND